MADTVEEKAAVPAKEEKPEATETPVVAEEKPASEPENKVVEEAKETDKMLEKTEEDNKEEKADEGKEKPSTDEIIDIPAEDADKKKKIKAEEREVKPKKIPIGGIKMPGFFTKKNQKKDKTGDGAEDELLKKEEEKEPEAKPEEKKEPASTSAGFFSNFKLWNPFAKKPAAAADPEAPAVEEAPKTDGEKKDEEKVEPETKEEAPKEEAKPEDEKKEDAKEPTADETAQPKKSRLSAIKLPHLSALIPKRFQKQQQQDDIELGNGPQTRAGLASMETLDDSQKDQDSKDTTDTKAAGDAKPEPNGNGAKPEDDKKAEKQNEENTKTNTTIIQRVRGYKCSIDDFAIFAGCILFLILVAIILAFTFTGNAKESKIAPVRDGKFVEAVTSCGNVEGIYEDNAFAFRGIPYAIPPVGERRFQLAEEIDNIDYCWNGTMEAHNASKICWQQLADGSIDGEEDCLKLDVVTPQVRYDNPLPVIVLIGADSLTGGSPNILRPSAVNARGRDVIFVRPNFRMNAFGFLASDLLSKNAHPKSSGNYALSDIIVALKWVQKNIGHFGGDPKQVVLMGHRAGGTLVAALASSQKAEKLFARAWISSASSIFPGKPLMESERANEDYVERLGCKNSNAECLKDVDPEDLLKKIPGEWVSDAQDLPARTENNTAHHDWLILEGNILKAHPMDVFKSRDNLPMMVFGTTAHVEHSVKLLEKYANWTKETVRKHVSDSKIGQLNLTEEALKRYGDDYKGLVGMISDIRTVCPLLSLTKSFKKPVPFYVVTQTSGELAIADKDVDVLAIVGRYEPKTPEQRRYVSAIQTMFYHFVSLGKIQNFSQNTVLDVGQDVLQKPEYPNCDFWIQNDVVPKYGRVD